MYAKNIKAIEKVNPNMAEFVRGISVSESAVEAGISEVAGRLVPYAVKEGKLFQLGSMYDTAEVMECFAADIKGVFNTVYVIFGLGDGSMLRALLNKSGSKNRFIVYEPAVEIFIKMINSFDISDVLGDERVTIIFNAQEDGKDNLYYLLAHSIDYADSKQAQVLCYMNYPAIYPEQCQYFFEVLGKVSRGIQANRTVNERFGSKYVVNTFKNAYYFANSKSITSLYGYIPDDIPAVIVAAGPSLNSQIEDLRKIKNRALIICVDSAISVLLRADIIPDMYVCVDPIKEEGNFVDPRVKDIPMVGVIDTSPYALEGHRAECYFVADNSNFVFDFISKNKVVIPALSTGGSVANDSASFAAVMGIKTIMLAGLDLAYTNNQTHAKGSLRADWNLDTKTTESYVEGLDGSMVRSSGEFNLYREWFEREIEKRPDINFINTTPAGAKIHGAIEMSLAEAARKYCIKEYDTASFFEFSAPCFKSDLQKRFRDMIDSYEDAFKDIKNILQQAVRKYDEMIKLIIENKYNNARFKKLYEQAIELSNEAEASPYIFFVQCMVQSEVGEILDSVYAIEEDGYTELRVSVERGKKYVEILLKGIALAKAAIDEVWTETVLINGDRDPLEEKIDILLNVATDRKSYIDALLDFADCYKASEFGEEIAERAKQKLLRLRESMYIQKYSTALALYAVTGDEFFKEQMICAVEGREGAAVGNLRDFALDMEQSSEKLIEQFVAFFENDLQM